MFSLDPSFCRVLGVRFGASLVYDAISQHRYLSKHRITKPFKAGSILLI